MSLNQTRLEVMQYLAQTMDQIVEAFLKKIDENWQPIDNTPKQFEVLCHNDFAIYNASSANFMLL